MKTILQGNLFDYLIGFAIIIVCFLLTYKKKKVLKVMDIQLLNKRILEYKPEQLINEAELNILPRMNIELAMPKDPMCLNLAKVNYMNLLENEELKNKAEQCIRTYGVGSCGPRGFYGTIDVHIDLENKIAEFLGLEETVLYSYGFSTISSAIGAYCKKSDYILCDEEISFPAEQGFMAARCTVVYFKHNDLEDLERKLNVIKVKETERNKRFRKFLVIEGIYLKTGQLCPLPKLIEMSRKYKMRIFLNETHSFGVLGKTGRGITEHFGIDRSEIDMIMGSLETSLGSVGGFCVGRSVVIEHQRLSGLGYCFSASLPPFLSYVPLCAIEMFDENPIIFKELEQVSIKMHEELNKLDEYVVMSHPVSPLKVVSIKNGPNIEKTDRIFNFCAGKRVYVLKMDDRLQLHLNRGMKDKEMKRIVDTLSEAIKVI